jgi:hypothetical protein
MDTGDPDRTGWPSTRGALFPFPKGDAVRGLVLSTLFLLLTTGASLADRAAFVALARQGWSYELRTTMIGRDLSIPVHINGRDLAGASLCIVGEPPQDASLAVLDSFRALVHRAYGKPMTMRYAGEDAALCGSGRTVILRLYSGFPPNRALADDLRWMDDLYQLGLRRHGNFAATSPAMAQTFFGRAGQGTHIMVQQPQVRPRDALEATFYRSILIEELFQSFTFGMDILIFDRQPAFLSKLQEVPTNLYRLAWDTPAFMRALVRTNPPGLCTFDIFMMHAVAEAPVDQTTEPAFIDFIDANYDTLLALAEETMVDPALASILEPDCRRLDF